MPADPLTSQREAFVAAFNRGDAAALSGFYASDAILLSFMGDPVTGSETISAGMARAASAFDLVLEPIRSRASATLITEAGTWRHREKGTTNDRDGGTYFWSWRREPDGRWVIDVHSVTRKPRPRT